MNYLSRFFVIFIAACVIASCAAPVGTINGNGSGTNTQSGSGLPSDDIMWLIPNRLLYDYSTNFSEPFNRASDLRIFAVDNGTFQEIASTARDVTVEIITNPGLTSEVATPVESYFNFSLAGRYIVRVTYKNNSDQYSIEVRGYFETDTGGSDFLDFIWL